MATSTQETAAPAGGATTAVRAPANGHSNRVLAASNDAVAASEEPRTLGHANRPRKRAHGETDEAAQATDTHGGTRVVERDKRLRVEATGAARESDVAEQLTQLTHQNEQLRSEMAALKDDLAQRDNTMDRVVGSLGSLEQVERETKVLQAKYDECAQKELAMIQDTKQRISDVLGKLDQLQRAGSLTAHELQGFRQDYNRQIDAVLAKVDALASATSQRTAPPHVDAVTAEEIHQLRDELAICKDELTEMEPRRASVENEFFQRMERFSNQLDHVRLQMSKMEQDLLQENAVSRRSLENLVSRQMAQHRHAQAGENKRLREEMDELRSDMCELLKEMHLLKERTKYLGRESTTRRGSGSIGLPGRSSSLSFPPRYTSNELRHSTPASSPLYATGYTSYLYAPPTQSRVPVHGDDELYCQHHHCPAGIPHGVAHGPPIEARASSPSPPRLTQSALLQAAASQAVPARLAVPVGDHHDLPRFCPSPHYSSRSSSVSGRISATRDEHAQADDAHVDDQELERRLLEKHRLFWIREGAGSVSQASLEPPTPKFPDEE